MPAQPKWNFQIKQPQQDQILDKTKFQIQISSTFNSNDFPTKDIVSPSPDNSDFQVQKPANLCLQVHEMNNVQMLDYVCFEDGIWPNMYL